MKYFHSSGFMNEINRLGGQRFGVWEYHVPKYSSICFYMTFLLNGLRKPPLMRTPPSSGDASASRLNTTAYPSANGYDYYRRPTATERSDYGSSGAGQDYYAAPSRNNTGYDRPTAQQQQGGNTGGGYGMQQQQQSKPYDSQTALQTQPIFF